MNKKAEKKTKIDKIWNILKSLTSEKYFVSVFLETIEETISEIVQLMDTSSAQDFDEDIHEVI